MMISSRGRCVPCWIWRNMAAANGFVSAISPSGSSCDCDARLFWQGLEEQITSYIGNHTLAQLMRVNKKTPAAA